VQGEKECREKEKASEKSEDGKEEATEQNAENGAEGKREKYSLNPTFETELQEWYDKNSNKEREKSGERFFVGTTSDILKSIGVKDYPIYFGASKINKILNANESMTLDIIKQAVRLLEDPILVMKSKTVEGSIVLFGEVYTEGKKPVMISVLLNPKSKNGEILDYAVITSAYGRRTSNLQNLIDTSKIYYVCENRERTDTWLKALGLQLPSALTTYGSINSIPDSGENVNTLEENSSEREDAEGGDELPNFHIDRAVDTDKLSATQRKQIDTVRTLASHLDGSNFVIINGMSEDYNAKFSPDVRTIFIDVNAGNKSGVGVFDYAITEACTHELAHYLKENAPQKYEELRQFIKAEFFTAQSYEAAVKARYDLYKKKRPSFTYELAEEEVIANAVENIFTKQNAIDKLAEKHRSLFSRIWQFVKNFFEKITGKAELALGVHSAKTFESDIVKTASERKQKQLEHRFVSALRTANENSKALASAGVVSKSEEKFSINENSDGFVNFVDSVNRMKDKSKISKRKYKIGIVSERHKLIVAEILKNNGIEIDLSEYELWIDGTAAEHIDLRHGEKGAADSSMASNDLRAMVPWVVNNADSGEIILNSKGEMKKSARFKNSDSSPAPQIRLKKKINSDTFIVSECVPDNSNKRIYITSAYINKKEQSSSVDMDENVPATYTSETMFENSATYSIPDSGENVNSNDKFSLSDTLDREVLTETFFGLAETEAEREVVRKYRDEIDNIGAMIDERNRLTRRFKEIEGKKGFAKERTEINAKLKTLEGMITRRDIIGKRPPCRSIRSQPPTMAREYATRATSSLQVYYKKL